MKPRRITATYKIVTPMFIGGANQTAEDGIRPPSVKGALRFWWRALNWIQIRPHYADDAEALRELHQKESILFGSANDNERQIGQGKFLLRITSTAQQVERIKVAGLGLPYLLGLGLYKDKKVLRDAIVQGSFTIQCLLQPSITTAEKESLEQTLLVFGLLGGLGSRGRKGFGSVAIESSTSKKHPVPKNKAELIDTLRQLKQGSEFINEPPFTAFSKLMRIDLSLSGNHALTLLSTAGEEQLRYRSWGYKSGNRHVVGGNPNEEKNKAEQKFKQSHHLMQDVSKCIEPDALPDKAVFGLPQNYQFRRTDDVDLTVGESNRSRRASPLFVHVHQFPHQENYLLLHTLLPAVFLEDNAQLSFDVFRREGKKRKLQKSFTLNYNANMTDWSVIENYLNRNSFADRVTI